MGSGLPPFPSPEHALKRLSCLPLQFILPVFQLSFQSNLPATLPLSSYNIVLGNTDKIGVLGFIIPYLKIESQRECCYEQADGSNEEVRKNEMTCHFVQDCIMQDHKIFLWVDINHPGRANKATELFAAFDCFQDTFLFHKAGLLGIHLYQHTFNLCNSEVQLKRLDQLRKGD